MGDYLAFRRFITPAFMQVIFWIFVAFNTISSIAVMFQGGLAVIAGLVQLFLGPVFIRVFCEVTIVFFRINETLEEVRRNSAQRPL